MARRLWLARLCLAWESLWPALWPAVAIAGIFLVAALFNLWSRVPGSLHAAALLLFAIGFILALIQGLRGWLVFIGMGLLVVVWIRSGWENKGRGKYKDIP